MRRFLKLGFVLFLLGVAVAWFLTTPSKVNEVEFAKLTGSATAGELIFAAGGCSSCHAVPKSEGEAKLILSGGLEFKTDFGTFYAPNISPHTTNGIGEWSVTDLANAMIHGTSPDGKHYYPAFPYASYSRSKPQDIADLHAYIQQLPVSDVANKPHDVGFPFNIRRSLGGWKLLFLKDDAVVDLPEELARGQYLVEGLGHCAECHTPRNLIGGPKRARWLAGGPNPDGEGRIPNITPHDSGIGEWSAEEIAEYLKTGFTPDFDVVGGSMASVVDNMAKLSDADLMAIAAYLKQVPALAK